MTKILVTGSAGLVGRQIVKDLSEKKFDVYSCYNEERSEFGIPTKFNLSKKEEIIDKLNIIKPEIIIHLAAMTNVDQCEKEKDLATLINTKATEILVQESVKHNIFFVYMSTDYVFDGKVGMKNENDIPSPLNHYGKTKLEGEIILKKLLSRYAIVRTSTPFGIHPKKKSFPMWVKENLELKKEIPVITNQYTSPTFVPNLSKMVIEVATKQISGILHLAGSTRISRFEFAKRIANKLNLDEGLLKPKQIDDMNWTAKRPHDSSLDVSKAMEILENKPLKIDSSLELFINQIT